ncbi:alkali metal cation/H+ antiporter Nha1 C terminus-domain-containing protein [Aspergillus unguis]
MAWDHLDIDKPHLAYMILGGFTGLFMLCSLFVKEKLYIGEATVATICGIIFGPHAANLFNPIEWGNVDKITLECSRIVLVVQCFAVGVELPKAYMERHWKSVTLLLLPVMTWGWLITSLFIWWLIPPLNWLDSLVCAACVTATDPVLASSVVGKGKFAKRVPRHLRDLLSAESGCNDGMAFPFIYLSYYILHYRPDANEVALHWFCVTILYECVFGAIFGFTIGYAARHAIRFAERKQLIDRESFLVFYFVLALFCAGSGSLLGMDDLLIGFAAGVGFSNDGWFTEKTEEAHVSNVIDLLLNLAYFVYLGAIVPWADFNNADIGLNAWRLVVIAILVIFFRRIPIMLLLKPIIPDVKTWREALFAGHFGPIGVGAIFACILARAELEHGSTQPEATAAQPQPGDDHYYIVQIIWPLTTFMVISSILVHGSSIAVFTLGKRINTLSITLSYTQANEEGPSWMNRLPRVQSLAKGSMSFRKADDSEGSSNEPEYPPGTLPPIGLPGNFLRRQQEDDSSSQIAAANRRARRRRRRAEGAGGPISQSAIAPLRPSEVESEDAEKALGEGDSTPSPPAPHKLRDATVNVYLEGSDLIYEDRDGNVLKTEHVGHMSSEEQKQHVEAERSKLNLELQATPEEHKPEASEEQPTAGDQIEKTVSEKAKHKKFGRWLGFGKKKAAETEKPSEEGAAEESASKAAKAPKGKGRSAHAYQFGNTIIVEDEDGEVIKKYSIPSGDKPETKANAPVRRGLTRMGTWFGMEEQGEASQGGKKTQANEWMADDGLRFTLATDDQVGKRGVEHKGKRMTKQQFAEQIRGLGPKARQSVVEESDAPERVKDAARDDAQEAERRASVAGAPTEPQGQSQSQPHEDLESVSSVSGDETDSEDAPGSNVADTLARIAAGTAAEDRRRDLSPASPRTRRDSEDDGTERVPPSQLRQAAGVARPPQEADLDDTGETPAERRRRLAALGKSNSSDSETGSDASDDDEAVEEDSEDDGNPRSAPGKVSFADGTKLSGGNTYDREGNGLGSSRSRRSRSGRKSSSRISWGGEKGRDS